ncbi:MAG TPA: DUF1501 domain-containing protein [Bryobacteraceae bacterium]|nr:DUF1501 domain-containing protein [Bryobacteraceae bacterium]
MKDKFGFDWNGITGTRFWTRPHVDRRMFFRHLASAVGGYFLLPSRPMETVAKAGVSPMNTAENCIFIHMSGAPSHVDTFDLKEGSWTPSFFNPTSYGDIRFPQGLMPKLAEQMDSIALVRSIKPWAAVHELARQWILIGRNPVSGLAKIAPHIGSVASIELGPRSADRTLPAFLALNTPGGPGAGYLHPDNGPFYVSPGGGGLGNTTHRDGQAAFERRFSLLQAMDAELRESGELGPKPNESYSFGANARKIMYNPAIDRIFTFDQTERNRYGNTGFGNACITARNLLRANMGTRFIQITIGGWDHHQNIYQVNNQLQSLSRQFDNGLGVLLADLKNDGLLDSTLVIAMGEFGRTVGPLNVTNGRDHHLQQSALFAGARIKGNTIIGSTTADGKETQNPGWSRDRDIRAEDIEATIYSALGIDWTTVRRDDPLGRGFEYVPFSGQDLYGPIHELWK